MTQPIANEQLSAYLDGELTDAERDELEKALAEDPALRQELARLQKAVSFFKLHGPVQAPRGFQEKVLAAVANEPMPGWWWRWMRRPFGIPIEGFAVALAAAMVLLVALPFGLKTASKSGMELSDPTGYVRGEDMRAVPGAAKGAAHEGNVDAPAAATPQEEEEPAVADLERDAEGDAQQMADGLLSVRGTDDTTVHTSAAKPLAKPDVTEPVVVGGTASVDAAPVQSANGPGYAGVQAAAAPGVLLKYDILTYDEDALTALQRIAAKYRGSVVDAMGASTKAQSLSLEPGHVYLVEIPASALAAFGDDLHELGMVTENADPRKWAGDSVTVQVTFQLMPSNSSRSMKPAASTTETQ